MSEATLTSRRVIDRAEDVVALEIGLGIEFPQKLDRVYAGIGGDAGGDLRREDVFVVDGQGGIGR